jgi:glycosyltransferase involved in cell wall biosynthesis
MTDMSTRSPVGAAAGDDDGGPVIYFLANSLTNPTGGSRAGVDILHSMIATHWRTAVVSLDRIELPRQIAGQSVPETAWLLSPRRDVGGERMRLHPRSLAGRLVRGVDDRRRWALLNRAQKARPPDLVVHNGFPEKGWANTRIFERARNRLLVVHSTPEAVEHFQRDGSSLTVSWAARTIEMADHLMFVSEELRDAWSEVASLSRQRVFVISNTCREDEAARVKALDRTRLRTSLGLPADAFVVSCVGRVEYGKGQDVLVAALPQLVGLVPQMRTVFVGLMTESGQQLPNRVRAMGLDSLVLFTGPRDDVYSFITASDMLIHPSRTEAQGLVVLEAMLLRTPILASAVGGIPSSIEHGESGWLVPPDDVQALVQGFRLLAHDRTLRERLCESAEARYWSRFSTAHHRERVQAMLAACL